MGRFLSGEASVAPAIPENYFDRATEEKLRAAGNNIADHAAIVGGAIPLQAWRGNTVRLFSNWLTLVAAAKARRSASRAVHTRRRAS